MACLFLWWTFYHECAHIARFSSVVHVVNLGTMRGLMGSATPHLWVGFRHTFMCSPFHFISKISPPVKRKFYSTTTGAWKASVDDADYPSNRRSITKIVFGGTAECNSDVVIPTVDLFTRPVSLGLDRISVTFSPPIDSYCINIRYG